MENFDEKKAREELIKRARRIKEEDVSNVLQRKKEIEKKFDEGPLKQYIDKAKLFFSLLRDYKAGNYKQIPFWSIAAIVAALLYVVNPFDLIPDAIPGIGLIDDAFVIAACWHMIERDLLAYQEWLAMS